MMRHKTQHDGWSSAMQPSFVTGPTRDCNVSFAEKLREGAALRQAVEAHIAAGGAYQVLPSTVAAQVVS